MFDWENCRHFLAVARTGTLSGAARLLGVDHATVSRRLNAFEASLRASLVERLPRACRLTPMGLRVYEQVKVMESAAFAVERLAFAEQEALTGKVTLGAPPVLATHLLAPRLAEFRQQFPHLQLSIAAQAQQVSLSRREADVVLRLVRPEEPSSVIRKLGQMRFGLYASAAYLAQHEARDWTFVAYDAQFADMPQQKWLLGIAGNRPIGCELSDITGHLAAARASAGVAGLPCFLGDAAPELVRVGQDEAPFARDIWLVVHQDLRRSAPTRAVMDFFAKVVSEHPVLGLEQ